MEPDILESLRIYLEEGSGCSDTVIDALASGYHAYAQVGNCPNILFIFVRLGSGSDNCAANQ